MVRSRMPGSKGGGVLRTLESTGISRGLFGGHKGWFYVGTSLWTLRTVRRLAIRNSEILISEELRPGQRIIIANGVATIEGPAAEPTAPTGTGRSGRRRGRRRRRKGR